MNLKRLVFLSIYILARAAEGAPGRIDNKVSYDASICQKVLRGLQPKILMSGDGDKKLYFKVPHTLRKMFLGESSYDIFTRPGETIFSFDPTKFSRYDISGGNLLFGDLVQAINDHPVFFAKLGFWKGSDEKYYGPDTKALNQKIKTTFPPGLQKNFEFADWRPDDIRDQLFSPIVFGQAILDGKVLLATSTYLLAHDRFDRHMLGYLLMPSSVFEMFRRQTELVQIVARNTKGLSDKDRRKIEVRLFLDLAQTWDLYTSQAGQFSEATEFDAIPSHTDPIEAKALYYWHLLNGVFPKNVSTQNEYGQALIARIQEEKIELSSDQKTFIMDSTLKSLGDWLSLDVIRTDLKRNLDLLSK